MAKGFDDNINTNVLIAGLWNASFNLGSFLGPTISGFVVQAFGFRGAIQKTFFFRSRIWPRTWPKSFLEF